MPNMATQLATESGLTWATIRRYAKSELLERDDDDRPIYMHHAKCGSFCEFACNGIKGETIAGDVETLEGYLPSEE